MDQQPREKIRIEKSQDQSSHKSNPYAKFALTLLLSFVVMYIVMYLHTYTWDHVYLSEMRFYMTTLMILAMVLVMLVMMWSMYPNRQINMGILAFAIIGFGIVTYIQRSQVFIKDRSWMSAMIPHHSIAILTSERADIRDLRVRELAKKIIIAQRQEIDEMQWLLRDIQANGIADTEEKARARPVPAFPDSSYQASPN